MGKTKKRQPRDNDDEKRQERILEQLKLNGRLPTPPSGHFHDSGERQQRRKDRKNERARLRNLKREYNDE